MAKILIVDDDVDLVDTTRIVLQKDGHTTDQAHTRQEGMAKVASFGPDLILLDVMMEFQDDGLAMAQELRRQGFSKPILMLTNVSKVTGLSFGKDGDVVPVDDFEEKPIEPSKLVQKVRALLAKAEG
jgi:DNA-binding response OmpR family regulator